MQKLIISNITKRLFRDERGQDLAEYGIALAIIGVGAAAAAVAIAGDVNTLWTNAQAAIASAV
jgi:Flp pilus assembly pilin Flp